MIIETSLFSLNIETFFRKLLWKTLINSQQILSDTTKNCIMERNTNPTDLPENIEGKSLGYPNNPSMEELPLRPPKQAQDFPRPTSSLPLRTVRRKVTDTTEEKRWV